MYIKNIRPQGPAVRRWATAAGCTLVILPFFSKEGWELQEDIFWEETTIQHMGGIPFQAEFQTY